MGSWAKQEQLAMEFKIYRRRKVMKFSIKNRWTGKVQYECELEAEFAGKSYGLQLGAAVRFGYDSDANLSDANLSDADLSDADLSGANLSGANLSGANLRDAT